MLRILRDKGMDELTFIDYLVSTPHARGLRLTASAQAYLPLFVDVHQAIVENPFLSNRE